MDVDHHLSDNSILYRWNLNTEISVIFNASTHQSTTYITNILYNDVHAPSHKVLVFFFIADFVGFTQRTQIDHLTLAVISNVISVVRILMIFASSLLLY